MLNITAFTIVIPVYNEEKIIERKTTQLIEYLTKFYENFQILFVENGSKDDTLKIVKNLSKNYRQISYISIPEADLGLAVVAGIKRSQTEKIIWFPIDFKTEITFINEAVRALDNFDIVLASKWKGKDFRSWNRVLISRFYNFLVTLIFNLGVADVEGYRAYRKNKIIDIVNRVTTKSHLFDLEILIGARKKGLKITEIPVTITETRKSKFINSIPKLMRVILMSFKAFIVLKIRYSL